MVTCNSTSEYESIEEEPLFASVTFHHVGLIISALFALISLVVASFLMYKHATHYSKPWEQKHIIRILLMIPIYSLVSFLSYLYYKHAIYFEVLRDCYEAFAIASFFTLLCNYIAPNLHEQKEYFRHMSPIKNWFWGVFGLQKCTGGKEKGWFRVPHSGLTWFNIIWIGVFQYCLIRVLFTIVSVITQATGRYCEESLSPAFAHVWVECFEGASVTIAMFYLIQFYLQLKTDLAHHKPFLKVICIKAVIFLSFWQTMLITFLSSAGAIKANKKMSDQDISIGIPSMLLCIEMAIFSVMHIWAFTWHPYDLGKQPYLEPESPPGVFSPGKPSYKGGWLGLKAIGDAFNPWDIIKASARGFRWLFVGQRYRHHDVSYHPEINKLGSPATTIPGPNVTTEIPLSATSQRPYQNRPRTGTYGEDDRTGLLGDAQPTGLSPTSNSPDMGHLSHVVTEDDTEADMGLRTPGSLVMPEPGHYAPGRGAYMAAAVASPGERRAMWEEDTGYHPPPQPQPNGFSGAHVADSPAQWDHWAGAGRPDH